MYRLWKYLFGWDYIAWCNSADNGVARVQVDGDGKVWYWEYKDIRVSDNIRKPDEVIWLTCSSKKYFKDINEKIS